VPGTSGQSSCRAIASTAKHTAVEAPSTANEVVRARTSRLSPRRFPLAIRESDFPGLKRTDTTIVHKCIN
jgi:hypothetical protein